MNKRKNWLDLGHFLYVVLKAHLLNPVSLFFLYMNKDSQMT